MGSVEQVARLRLRDTAVTLGVFDGVHRGHRKIVEELVAHKSAGKVSQAVLITFHPHPLTVTHSRLAPPLLSTVEERVELLSASGLDGILAFPFDQRVAAMDYRDFIEKYLLRILGMKVLVLGYDCHLGRNREGSPERVSREAGKMGFEAVVVPPVRAGAEIISSTRIRNEVIEGRLEQAEALLGHPYLVAGTVASGHGYGKDLGYPTANLQVRDRYKLWPPRGVYAVQVRWDERWWGGMMNVGSAPTLKRLGPGRLEMEVHLFDFQGELYGETLYVYLVGFLRGEKKFPSPVELARQLARDEEKARELLEQAAKKEGLGG